MTKPNIVNVNVTQPPTGNILWSSTAWANGNKRTINTGGKADPDDPKLRVYGSSPICIDGNGIMRVSGPVQRIYIMQPHENIRLTCKVRTIMINPDPDSSRGHVFEVRTSPHHPSEGTDNAGVAYAYYFRYDMGASYKKELTHKYYTPETARVPISINFAEWVTLTMECFNTANGVKLVSKINGHNVTSFEDTGNWVAANGRREIIKNGDPYPGTGQLYPSIILRDTQTTKEYKDVVVEAI